VLTAAVTATVQVSDKFKAASLWLFISLYAVAFLLPVAAALMKSRSSRAAEDRKWAEHATQFLALSPTTDGQLPRVSAVQGAAVSTALGAAWLW
jgi:hypothetical protein